MPSIGAVALIIALFIGISRVYLEVHYISDVVFGALLGLGIGYGLHRFKHWKQANRSGGKRPHIEK